MVGVKPYTMSLRSRYVYAYGDRSQLGVLSPGLR